jgi:hypothetical protein
LAFQNKYEIKPIADMVRGMPTPSPTPSPIANVLGPAFLVVLVDVAACTEDDVRITDE